jgi:hypothetical protein
MIMHVTVKCNDMFYAHFTDKNTGESQGEFQGYVPEGFNIGSGDYVGFDVDTETGRILNWAPITDMQVRSLMIG